MRESYVASEAGAVIFKLLKAVPILVFAWLFLVWLDLFREKKRTLTRFLFRFADGLISTWRSNRDFIAGLYRGERYILIAILLAQLLFCCYCISSMPLSFDEWWSYRYFSGNNFWHTMSWYPSTNNHIFFNLVAGLMTALPFDPEQLLRLPSLGATLLTSYYFFKISRQFFGGGLSLLLLSFVATVYPVSMYCFQGRGYALFSLFFVLLLYCSLRLLQECFGKKYRGLMVISTVLGFYTMPTFLYAAAPVFLFVSVSLLTGKKSAWIWQFVADVCISALLVLLCYLPVLLLNEIDILFSPHGATRFLLSDPGAFGKIKIHLAEILDYISLGKYTLYVLLLVATLCLVRIILKPKDRFFCSLCLCFLISPLIILMIHMIIPFQRTWLYLVYPFAICIGYSLTTLFEWLRIRDSRTLDLVLGLGGAALCVILFTRFPVQYRKTARFDFEMEDLRNKTLEPLLGRIRKIGYSKSGYEFYAADIIYAHCHKDSPGRYVGIGPIDEIRDEDIVILETKTLPRYRSTLGPYKLLKVANHSVCIFAGPRLQVKP